MTYLENQIAEAKAAEFVLLAEQATDGKAQDLNTRIAQELYSTVDVLKRSFRLNPAHRLALLTDPHHGEVSEAGTYFDHSRYEVG